MNLRRIKVLTDERNMLIAFLILENAFILGYAAAIRLI